MISFSCRKLPPLHRSIKSPQAHPSEYAVNALTRINSLLVMKFLHQKIRSSGSWFANRVVNKAPPRLISSVNFLFANRTIFLDDRVEFEDFDQENSFDSLRRLYLIEKSEYAPGDAIVVTAGLASQILFYGAFSLAIGAFPVPLENWNVIVLTLGPWWSSSYWTEWVCYDFFMSCFRGPCEGVSSNQDLKPSPVDRFVKLFPYDFHPELNHAYNNNKKSFYLCAFIIASVYLYVYFIRPPVTDILISKAKESYNPELTADVAKWIVDSMNRSITDLEGCMFSDY